MDACGSNMLYFCAKEGESVRILLMDDEKPLSAAIVKLLARRQFVVDPAYDGSTGLNLALTGDYDAVILDVMLPEMDGFSVLRAIRAKGSSAQPASGARTGDDCAPRMGL